MCMAISTAGYGTTTQENARRRPHHASRTARPAASPLGHEWVGSTAFAYAYASLRDTTETLHWFDSMLVHRDPAVQAIPLDPEFDFLRDDPRYRVWEAKLPWSPRRPGPVSTPEEQGAAPQ